MSRIFRRSTHPVRLAPIRAGKFCLILLVMQVLAAVGHAAPGEVLPLTKGWLDLRPADRGVPQVDEEVRLKMIAELNDLNINHAGKPNYPRPRIDLLLVDLGDEATIDRYVKSQFGPGPRGTSGQVLPASRQPLVVARLGPAMMRDEPINEIVLLPRTVEAAQLCLTLVQSCPEFPTGVKRWAAELQSTWKDRAALRAEVRSFWLENEAFLKAKSYQAVRPPGTASAHPPQVQPSTNHPNSAIVAGAAAASRTNERPAAGAGRKPSTPPEAVLPIPAPAPPPAWPWMLGVGGLLACLLWWRSRSGA